MPMKPYNQDSRQPSRMKGSGRHHAKHGSKPSRGKK